MPQTTGVNATSENEWAEVYDELGSHQSLASVINDPKKGRARPPSGIGDLIEKLREHAEEVADQRELEAQEEVDAAVLARTDELVGTLPSPAEFAPYLEALVDLWDIYHRNHRARQQRPLPGQTPQNAGGAVAGDKSLTPKNIAELSSPQGDACDAHHAVPHEYFSSEFRLEAHQVFRQSLQTSVEREEELDAELRGHLDLIEVSLFEHIRRAQRDQLFESLARLGEPLQEDLRSALSVGSGLRGKLRSVQKNQLRYSMAVGRLARRKQRVAEVLQRLDCLTHIRESQPSVQMLLQGQDYVTALELLESTRAAMDCNLRGLVSANDFSKRLSSLADTFDRAVEADFVQMSAEAILSGAPQAEPGDQALKRLCYCLAKRGLLRSALGSTLRDVLLNQLKKALKTQARTLLEELSAAKPTEPDDDKAETVAEPATSPRGGGPPQPNKTSPEPSPRPEDQNSSAAAPSGADALATSGITAALTSLTFDNFFIFWQRMMQDCVAIAERYLEFSVLIQDTAKSLADEVASGPRAFSSSIIADRPGDTGETSAELLRLFEVIMTALLQKVGVLLQARQGDTRQTQCCPKMPDWKLLLEFTNASLDKVKALQEQCKQYLKPKETVTVNDIRTNMRTILYMQTKNVIEVFHEQRLLQAEAALRQEKWEKTDVPQEYKQLMDQLIGLQEAQQNVVPDYTTVESASVVGREEGSDRCMRIDGVNYLVVPAVLTLVQILTEYLQLCRDFENLGAEIVQRMVVLLRRYNVEMKALVLGGQAVHRGVVKSINASNLALCSRCCELIEQVLPRLQATILDAMQGKGAKQQEDKAPIRSIALSRAVAALAEDLSQVAGAYRDHRMELLGKLSDLLRDRYEQTASSWLKKPHPEVGVDFEKLFSQGGTTAEELELCPHDSLDGLVKGISMMYKVLLKNLSNDCVRRIFAKAFEDIAVKFEQRLAQELLAPSPPYGDRVGHSLGDRLVMDIAYLREKLGSCLGITAPLQRLLQDLVHHLRVRLPVDDPSKALHLNVLEALQRKGKLPPPQ